MDEKKQKIIERIEKLECFLWNSMRWYWRIALKRDVEGKNPHIPASAQTKVNRRLGSPSLHRL